MNKRKVAITDLSNPDDADALLGVLALTLDGCARCDAERIESFCSDLGFDPRDVMRQFLSRCVFIGLNEWRQ